MDFTPYLPRENERKDEYYHRLWLSDLWDTISVSDINVPNEVIRIIQHTKLYVWRQPRERLAEMMRQFEEDMLKPTDTRSYLWLKMYCKRLYKRKNMLCTIKTYPNPPTCPPIQRQPSTLRT